MPDANTIEKIYDVKIIGGKEAYQTLSDINQMFIQIKENKNSGVIGLKIDNSSLAALNTLDKSIQNLMVGMKDLGVIGQKMSADIAAAMSKVNMANIQTQAGFNKLQGEISEITTGISGFTMTAGTLSQQLVNTKANVTELQSSLTALNKEYKAGSITEEEFTIQGGELTQQLIQQRSESTYLTSVIKAQVTAQDALSGSVRGARAEIAQLNKEQENLVVIKTKDLSITEEEIAANKARVAEIIAEKDALHAFIATQADSNLQRILNIGNYPQVQAGFQSIIEKMEELKVQGKDTTEEYRKLEEELVQVASTTKNIFPTNGPSSGIGDATSTISSRIIALKTNMQQLALEGKEDTEVFELMRQELMRLTTVMNEVTASVKNVSNVGDKLTSMIERMGLRMLLNMFIFQGAMEALQAIGTSIMENTEGTQAYIDKQVKLQEANASLTQSFKDLGDAMQKYNEEENLLNQSRDLPGGQAESVGQLKRDIDDWTALGMIKHQQFDYEAEMLKRNLALHNEELVQLNQKKESTETLTRLITESQKISGSFFSKESADHPSLTLDYIKKTGETQERYGKLIIDKINQFDISTEAKTKLILDIQKAQKEGTNTITGVYGGPDLAEVLTKSLRSQKIEAGKLLEDIANKENQIKNDQIAYDAKMEKLKDDKKVELDKSYQSDKEQLRQENERLDIASVDKIVGDVHAKYSALANQLKKDKELYRLSVTSKEDVDYLDDNIRKYNDILNILHKIGEQEIKNQEYELELTKTSNFRKTQSSLSGTSSSLYAGNADFGFANYGKMADAIDKENEAKKIALKNSFIDQASTIEDSDQVIEAQKQYDLQLEAIDRDSYKRRIGLANDYFKKMSQNTIDAAAIVSTELDTKITDQLTELINSKMGDSAKERALKKITQKGIISKSADTIKLNESLLPGANEAVNSTKSAMDNAVGVDQLAEATRHYNAALQQQADILKNISQAKNEAANAQKELEHGNDALYQEIKNQALSAFEQIGNAYIHLLEQQSAYRDKQLQRQLDFNKKELDGQAQSNKQRMANDRAFDMEQQQRERAKAKESLKLAEAQMAMDYAVGVMKIWSVNAVDPVLAGLETAGLTAVYTAKLAMMSSQQFEMGGEVPSNGGMFGGRSHTAGGTPFLYNSGRFEAEAGELAIINKNSAGSNQVMTVTGTPKQIASGINAYGGGYNFAPGASVHKYAWGGSLGAQIQPPAFISDYYSRQADNGQGSAMELAKALQMHIESTSSQFHNLRVSLDHRDVTEAQSKNAKAVSVGTFGGK